MFPSNISTSKGAPSSAASSATSKSLSSASKARPNTPSLTLPKSIRIPSPQGEHTIKFGKFRGAEESKEMTAYVLNNKHKNNLNVQRFAYREIQYSTIRFTTHSPQAKGHEPEDLRVELEVSSSGNVLTCSINNAENDLELYYAKFKTPAVEETAGSDAHTSANAPATSIEALKQQWKNQQNALRQGFAEQKLIKQDVIYEARKDEPPAINEEVFQSAGHLAQMRFGKGKATRESFKDLSHLVANTEWAIETRRIENKEEGLDSLRDNLDCQKLHWLSAPQALESIGHNFRAPELRRLDFFTQKEDALSPTGQRTIPVIKGGKIHCIGNNFYAPNLQTLNLNEQKRFRSFGSGIHLPNVTALHLKNAINLKELPNDLHLPSLVTIDLTGAKNFRAFPQNFFTNSPNIRSIELLGTQVRFAHLPQHIRDNQAIYIDLRPENLREQRIGGQQTTHSQTVHKSSTDSAKRIMAKLGNTDLDTALSKLDNHVRMITPLTPPEDLEPKLKGDTTALIAYVMSLDHNHPHRAFFTNKQNAAKRAMEPNNPFHNYRDRGSNIRVIDYLAACFIVMENAANRHEQVTINTAQEKITQALYEIKRGYNLKGEDNDLQDDGDPRDLTICGPGAFNKVTNIMSEAMVDVETIYITDDLIRMKANGFIREAIEGLLADGQLSAKDFMPPDEDGEIFLENSTGKKINQTLYTQFAENFNDYSIDDKRKKVIKDFFDYQLLNTDLSKILNAATSKGKEKA